MQDAGASHRRLLAGPVLAAVWHWPSSGGLAVAACACASRSTHFAGPPGSSLMPASHAHLHVCNHQSALGAASCLQILERGREISKRDWQLLRVAIVELRGSVFIGRCAPCRRHGSRGVAWRQWCAYALWKLPPARRAAGSPGGRPVHSYTSSTPLFFTPAHSIVPACFSPSPLTLTRARTSTRPAGSSLATPPQGVWSGTATAAPQTASG